MKHTTSTGLPERKAIIKSILDSGSFADLNAEVDRMTVCLQTALGIGRDAKAKLKEAEAHYDALLKRNVELRDAISQALTARDETVASAILLKALADDAEARR